ncbi:MAG: PQQ-binding-like beta-propeller repeat protein [Planctomycetaceae bacterium]
MEADQSPLSDSQHRQPPTGLLHQLRSSRPIRILTALICSHLLAPYAAARACIRYSLDQRPDWPYIIAATLVISVGAVCAMRLFVKDSTARKTRLIGLGLFLWVCVAFVMLKVAVRSSAPIWWLVSWWSVGTLWVAGLVWTLAFFRSMGSVVTALITAAMATAMWNTIQITGLTGDAKVEIALRKPEIPMIEIPDGISRRTETGEVLWSGYLGSDRQGDVRGIVLNEDWKLHPPQEIWRQSCGSGWSSFAVTSTMLFSQEQLQGQDCVTARSLQFGELLWAASEERPGFESGMGGNGPRATPGLVQVDDELLVVAVGPTGMLSCLEAATGQLRWKADMAELFPGENLPHGNSASPLVFGDLVVACPSAQNGPAMVAFRLADGTVAWKADSDWRSSYASPTLVTGSTDDHGRQIVLHGSQGVLSVQADSGQLLWQFPWTNEWDNNATQPLMAGSDLVIATGYRGGVARLSISGASVTDGKPRVLWENRRTLKTKFCNVTSFDETLVGLDNGILVGVNAQTGDQLWKDGRYGHGQVLKVGHHLLVIDEQGSLHLLKPDAVGQHAIAEFPVFDRKTWNHPAMANDLLLLRNDQEMVCLKLPVN